MTKKESAKRIEDLEIQIKGYQDALHRLNDKNQELRNCLKAVVKRIKVDYPDIV